jgi:hypothetical protein
MGKASLSRFLGFLERDRFFFFSGHLDADGVRFTVAKTAMPIPDFSGPWGRNEFDFEPASGNPKPVDNLAPAGGGGNASMLVGNYNNPLLKPEAAAVVKRRGELALTGASVPDPSNQCAPFAPPFTFSMELGVQLLQAKDHVTFLYNQDDQVRRVWLNRVHPRNGKPTPMGDSVGRYEGDTLVVDTVDIATGPLAMNDRYGTPRSRSALGMVPRPLAAPRQRRLRRGHLRREQQRLFQLRYGFHAASRQAGFLITLRAEECDEDNARHRHTGCDGRGRGNRRNRNAPPSRSINRAPQPRCVAIATGPNRVTCNQSQIRQARHGHRLRVSVFRPRNAD